MYIFTILNFTWKLCVPYPTYATQRYASNIWAGDTTDGLRTDDDDGTDGRRTTATGRTRRDGRTRCIFSKIKIRHWDQNHNDPIDRNH